jgi:hypothetical protein
MPYDGRSQRQTTDRCPGRMPSRILPNRYGICGICGQKVGLTFTDLLWKHGYKMAKQEKR